MYINLVRPKIKSIKIVKFFVDHGIIKRHSMIDN